VVRSDGATAALTFNLLVNEPARSTSESVTMDASMGTVQLSALDAAQALAGTTITSFTLPGSSLLYPAGPQAVTVTDPVSQDATGSVVVQTNGAVTFTADAGFTGQVPPITYTTLSSDGQTSASTISIVVESCKWKAGGMPSSIVTGGMHAYACGPAADLARACAPRTALAQYCIMATAYSA
jgi:hypothetical protein